MSLDHYVPQVHLKNFYSPKLGNLMYAIRKSDLKLFTPNTRSVCRIEQGNTNSFLREDRIVEAFLKRIEPRYNSAVEKLITNRIDPECIFVIAGFIAYVFTCSPAGMRILSESLKPVVENVSSIIDSRGSLPPPPPELGGKSLTELLQNGTVRININPKYPQAIGIQSILLLTASYGNFDWDILINSFEDSPFFTSDFPIAIEHGTTPDILNRIVPLAPTLAIRIRPNRSYKREGVDFSFSHFRRAIRKLDRSRVMDINKLIVRCAETMVFFRDNHDWVSGFVKKNSGFHVETKSQRVPYKRGNIIRTTQEITKTTEQCVSPDR